jgi:hypothetical protein
MLRPRTLALPSKVVVGLLLANVACAQAEGLGSDRNAGTGGNDDDSGGTTSSGGGMSTSGGSANSGGGGVAGADTGKGGATTGGSSSASGGNASKGGSTTGGSPATGGTTSSGGVTAKGGTSSTGGSTAKGGTTNTGTPGDTLLSDDFEDQDATDWYAADMNGTRAVTMQDSGYAYVMTSTSKAMSVGGDVTWTNQRLEVKVKFLEAANSPVLYVMARWADAKSYIVIEFRPGDSSDPEGDMKLRQSDGGSTTDLCRFKPASVLPNTWYTIGLSVSGGLGSTATLLFGGQAVTADKPCALTKEKPVAGGVALGIQNGSAAFDDVLVKVP